MLKTLTKIKLYIKIKLIYKGDEKDRYAVLKNREKGSLAEKLFRKVSVLFTLELYAERKVSVTGRSVITKLRKKIGGTVI